MSAILVAHFHARDAEGRVYPVHEFHELPQAEDGSQPSAPVVTYRLAIGERVTHLGDDRFKLLRSGVELTRDLP
ncbi:hypothetical protein [Pseudomonas typographi]|uniref:Uncharacterized protein n=1 Tax=Pseudomonas typographi TaxID=2715964 RepID=A0ABR7Z469_9PSED|nr:hypothetical protein [Pseudomonas typographi]MBD1552017.1 hypothetical protein [Pseudomonas typographi]MBD1586580.1 hypothetical protein [Pseudomonas typographi]MBD1600081.1 hypothetical protein [Pseudomonas typographi]